MKNKINYPVYRKYKNNRVFFKVVSITEWEEIHLRNGTYLIEKFTVSILPDRNYIYDLTFDFKKNWEEINAYEYEEIFKKTLDDK